MKAEEKAKQKDFLFFKVFGATGFLIDQLDALILFAMPKEIKSRLRDAKQKGNLLLKALKNYEKSLHGVESILVDHDTKSKDYDLAMKQLCNMADIFGAWLQAQFIVSKLSKTKKDVFNEVVIGLFDQITEKESSSALSPGEQNSLKILINQISKRLEKEAENEGR